ncbi:MAG TPA: MMPL family transporter [Propionibacteriaceae bacterium]|nr:MMPL family transporter [Propionibacteriaceae bacterium]
MRIPQVLQRSARAASRGLSKLGRVYRTAVTAGRWIIVAVWIAAATLVTVLIPAGSSSGAGFGNLLPPDSPVLKVEERVLEEFSVPVLAGTTVVVHKTGGLTLLTRADSVLWALATTQDVIQAPVDPPPGNLLAAIPVPTGRTDTTVTYLYVTEGTGLRNSVRLAGGYAAHFRNQSAVGAYVTGFVPAQVAHGEYLRSRLHLFEIASVLLILFVVALAFRSLLAPLVVLAIAAIGYLVYFPLLDQLAQALKFEVPRQLEPVLLALLLGVVTDYCVLFFSAFRDELDTGTDSVTSARNALRLNGSMVAVAGLTVAGGTIALLAAPFEIFRALGPALALTVLVGLAICLTLTPAVMTISSWRLFTVLPVRGSERGDQIEFGHPAERMRLLTRGIRLLTRRGVALGAAAGVVVLLGLASLPLAQARLDLSFTAGLPRDDSVAEGAQLLGAAGIRGISAPTEVLIEQEGVTRQRAELSRLEEAISRQPGVVKVLGPEDLPTERASSLVLAESGNAARLVVIYDSDPLAAEAIDNVLILQRRMPELARESGLPQAVVSMTGQTLIAAEVAQLTRDSLQITLVVALLVELLILSIYLRALIAPLALLACSVLSVTAALGLTTLLFQNILGGEGLTFYAPFSAAVLLIALGSDYNVFSVGSIWDEAKRRPMAQALIIAVPRASHAITVAGLILAATFALVAVIPLSTFRQIAFAMTVGLLLDTLIIRPVLTPAVLTLLGRWASWPSKRVTTGEPRGAEAPTTEPVNG